LEADWRTDDDEIEAGFDTESYEKTEEESRGSTSFTDVDTRLEDFLEEKTDRTEERSRGILSSRLEILNLMV